MHEGNVAPHFANLRRELPRILHGIPPQVFDYKLGNRSALDWIIDQYRVKTDKRSGITNDPNNLEDETYILRLIKQVVTVSLETVQLVNNLPPLEILEEA